MALNEGERDVTQIVRAVVLPRKTVSRGLNFLRVKEMLEVRKDGRRRLFRIDDDYMAKEYLNNHSGNPTVKKRRVSRRAFRYVKELRFLHGQVHLTLKRAYQTRFGKKLLSQYFGRISDSADELFNQEIEPRFLSDGAYRREVLGAFREHLKSLKRDPITKELRRQLRRGENKFTKVNQQLVEEYRAYDRANLDDERGNNISKQIVELLRTQREKGTDVSARIDELIMYYPKHEEKFGKSRMAERYDFSPEGGERWLKHLNRLPRVKEGELKQYAKERDLPIHEVLQNFDAIKTFLKENRMKEIPYKLRRRNFN